MYKKLSTWIYAISFIIFSAILVSYAYDIEHGTPISFSSTNEDKQEILLNLAKAIGYKGSIAVAILVVATSLYFAIGQHFKD